MQVGDLVRIKHCFTGHGAYEEDPDYVAIIIFGPNEVGKIRLLMPNGELAWRHTEEVEYLPRSRQYLKQ